MPQKGILAAFARSIYANALAESQFDLLIRIAEGYHKLSKKNYPDTEKISIEILSLMGQVLFKEQPKRQQEELLDAFFEAIKKPNSDFRRKAFENFTNIAINLDKSSLNETPVAKHLVDFYKGEFQHAEKTFRNSKRKMPYIKEKENLMNRLLKLSEKSNNEVVDEITKEKDKVQRRLEAIVVSQVKPTQNLLKFYEGIDNTNNQGELKKYFESNETKTILEFIEDEKAKLYQKLTKEPWTPGQSITDKLSAFFKNKAFDPKDQPLRERIDELEALEQLVKRERSRTTPTFEGIQKFATAVNVDDYKTEEEIMLLQKSEKMELTHKERLEALARELQKPYYDLSKIKNATELSFLRSESPENKERIESMEREVYTEKSWFGRMASYLPLPIVRFFTTVDIVSEIKKKALKKIELAKNDPQYQGQAKKFELEKQIVQSKIQSRINERALVLKNIRDAKSEKELLNLSAAHGKMFNLFKQKIQDNEFNLTKKQVERQRDKLINMGAITPEMAKKSEEYRQVESALLNPLLELEKTYHNAGPTGLNNALMAEKSKVETEFKQFDEYKKNHEELLSQLEKTKKEDLAFNVARSRYIKVKELIDTQILDPAFKTKTAEIDISTIGFMSSLMNSMEKIDTLTYGKVVMDMLPTIIEQENQTNLLSSALESIIAPQIRSVVSKAMSNEVTYISKNLENVAEFTPKAPKSPNAPPLQKGVLQNIADYIKGLSKSFSEKIQAFKQIKNLMYTVRNSLGTDLKLDHVYVENHIRDARNEISKIGFDLLAKTEINLRKILTSLPKKTLQDRQIADTWQTNLGGISRLVSEISAHENEHAQFLKDNKGQENTGNFKLQQTKFHKEKNQLFRKALSALNSLSEKVPEVDNHYLIGLMSVIHQSVIGLVDLQDGINALDGANRIIANRFMSGHTASFEALKQRESAVSAPMPKAEQSTEVKFAKAALNVALEKFDNDNMTENVFHKYLEKPLILFNQFTLQIDNSLEMANQPKHVITPTISISEILSILKSGQIVHDEQTIKFLLENIQNKKPTVGELSEILLSLKNLNIHGVGKGKIAENILKTFHKNLSKSKQEMEQTFNEVVIAVMNQSNTTAPLPLSYKMNSLKEKIQNYKELQKEFLSLSPSQLDYLKGTSSRLVEKISDLFKNDSTKNKIITDMESINKTKKGSPADTPEIKDAKDTLKALFVEIFKPNVKDLNKFNDEMTGANKLNKVLEDIKKGGTLAELAENFKYIKKMGMKLKEIKGLKILKEALEKTKKEITELQGFLLSNLPTVQSLQESTDGAARFIQKSEEYQNKMNAYHKLLEDFRKFNNIVEGSFLKTKMKSEHIGLRKDIEGIISKNENNLKMVSDAFQKIKPVKSKRKTLIKSYQPITETTKPMPTPSASDLTPPKSIPKDHK